MHPCPNNPFYIYISTELIFYPTAGGGGLLPVRQQEAIKKTTFAGFSYVLRYLQSEISSLL